MSQRDHDIFTPRGITPPWERGGHVAKAQGFARYEGKDWRERREALAAMPGAELFRSKDALFVERLTEGWGLDVGLERLAGRDVGPGKRMTRRGWETWLRTALAVDGWALPRFSPLPDELERPATQVRPDVPVQGRWKPPHRHAWLRGDARGREEASPRTRHAAKVCDLAPEGHPQAIPHPAGDFLPTGHLHPMTGELVVPREGGHRHWTQAKYLYTPGGTARWLGTHPSSLADGFGADDLFVVVLEGTLKMCAVTEAGYPTIDAGSVTLWNSSYLSVDVEDGEIVGGVLGELDTIARQHLRGRRVAVVCDSDWYANRLVLEQTQTVTAILRWCGAQAVACAPPEGESLGWRHPWTGVEMRAKLGVDDWLGRHPKRCRHQALLDLVVREPLGSAAPGLESAVDHLARRRDQADSLRRFLDGIGREADEEGLIAYQPGRLSRTTGLAERTLDRRRDDAMAGGVLEQLTDPERRGDGFNVWTEPALYRLGPGLVAPRRIETLSQWLKRPYTE